MYKYEVQLEDVRAQVEIRGTNLVEKRKEVESNPDLNVNDILSRTDLTNDAASTRLLLFWDALSAALPPVVFRVSLHAVPHQHAGASGGLKDLVYAFYFER